MVYVRISYAEEALRSQEETNEMTTRIPDFSLNEELPNTRPTFRDPFENPEPSEGEPATWVVSRPDPKAQQDPAIHDGTKDP